MTAEIVNLRRARKTKSRADKAVDSAANRALHGRTRAQRDAEAVGRARATRDLDNHRLQDDRAGDGDAR